MTHLDAPGEEEGGTVEKECRQQSKFQESDYMAFPSLISILALHLPECSSRPCAESQGCPSCGCT